VPLKVGGGGAMRKAVGSARNVGWYWHTSCRICNVGF
jgi:hypothetical protein